MIDGCGTVEKLIELESNGRTEEKKLREKHRGMSHWCIKLKMCVRVSANMHQTLNTVNWHSIVQCLSTDMIAAWQRSSQNWLFFAHTKKTTKYINACVVQFDFTSFHVQCAPFDFDTIDFVWNPIRNTRYFFWRKNSYSNLWRCAKCAHIFEMSEKFASIANNKFHGNWTLPH